MAQIRPTFNMGNQSQKLNSICADVSLCFPLPLEIPTHSFVPGQSVLIKSLKLMKVGEPKYLGPAIVIAVTRTGVLTDYQPQWIHASRLKHCPTGEAKFYEWMYHRWKALLSVQSQKRWRISVNKLYI
uniref:Uncharacterized protein n=1 Tax=Sinocyclocheilus anshuiensis TaxID=1608454 RepID=A0A671K1P1_9TELE